MFGLSQHFCPYDSIYDFIPLKNLSNYLKNRQKIVWAVKNASFSPWGQIIYIIAHKTSNYAGNNFSKNLIELLMFFFLSDCFIPRSMTCFMHSYIYFKLIYRLPCVSWKWFRQLPVYSGIDRYHSLKECTLKE